MISAPFIFFGLYFLVDFVCVLILMFPSMCSNSAVFWKFNFVSSVIVSGYTGWLSSAIGDPRPRNLVPRRSYWARGVECGVFGFVHLSSTAIYAFRDRVFPVTPLRTIGLYVVAPTVGADILGFPIHSFTMFISEKPCTL